MVFFFAIVLHRVKKRNCEQKYVNAFQDIFSANVHNTLVHFVMQQVKVAGFRQGSSFPYSLSELSEAREFPLRLGKVLKSVFGMFALVLVIQESKRYFVSHDLEITRSLTCKTRKSRFQGLDRAGDISKFQITIIQFICNHLGILRNLGNFLD